VVRKNGLKNQKLNGKIENFESNYKPENGFKESQVIRAIKTDQDFPQTGSSFGSSLEEARRTHPIQRNQEKTQSQKDQESAITEYYRKDWDGEQLEQTRKPRVERETYPNRNYGQRSLEPRKANAFDFFESVQEVEEENNNEELMKPKKSKSPKKRRKRKKKKYKGKNEKIFSQSVGFDKYKKASQRELDDDMKRLIEKEKNLKQQLRDTEGRLKSSMRRMIGMSVNGHHGCRSRCETCFGRSMRYLQNSVTKKDDELYDIYKDLTKMRLAASAKQKRGDVRSRRRRKRTQKSGGKKKGKEKKMSEWLKDLNTDFEDQETIKMKPKRMNGKRSGSMSRKKVNEYVQRILQRTHGEVDDSVLELLKMVNSENRGKKSRKKRAKQGPPMNSRNRVIDPGTKYIKKSVVFSNNDTKLQRRGRYNRKKLVQQTEGTDRVNHIDEWC
jgi:hypothetical protein